MFHPLMPDLSAKSTDEIVKEMNDLYSKARMFGRHNEMLVQLNLLINAYREEYTKRLNEDIKKQNKPKKENRKDDE